MRLGNKRQGYFNYLINYFMRLNLTGGWGMVKKNFFEYMLYKNDPPPTPLFMKKKFLLRPLWRQGGCYISLPEHLGSNLIK